MYRIQRNHLEKSSELQHDVILQSYTGCRTVLQLNKNSNKMTDSSLRCNQHTSVTISLMFIHYSSVCICSLALLSSFSICMIKKYKTDKSYIVLTLATESQLKTCQKNEICFLKESTQIIKHCQKIGSLKLQSFPFHKPFLLTATDTQHLTAASY